MRLTFFTFCLLTICCNTFSQNRIPKSWQLESTVEYTDSEGIEHVDSIFKPTPESDTIEMRIRMTITILESGKVSEIEILDSKVDFMDDNKLNTEKVEIYEEETVEYWERVYSEESN